MAIYKTIYGLPGDQEDNPYLIDEDLLKNEERNRTWKYGGDPNAPLAEANPNFDEYSILPPGVPHTPEGLEQFRAAQKAMGELKSNRFAKIDGSFYTGSSNPIVDIDTDTEETDVDQDEPITGETDTDTEEPDVTGEDESITGETEAPTSEETETPGADEETDWNKIYEELLKSGSITDKYKAAIQAAIEAQQLTTKQAVEQLEYQKELAEKARVKANREADLTFSRAINSTGKINQNIRSAGLAGSGWQETSQVGLTNAYQNALNKNTSDYNTAVKELNLAISQARQSGDIATMQAIQTYAIQLAQQLYQEARDAVADRQWELSYQLQKAAFDLQKAAQEGSNSNYYNTGSPYQGNSESDSEDEINSEESKTIASDINDKIQELIRNGTVREDLKYYISMYVSNYMGNLRDEDIEALVNAYGMTVDEIDQYI